MAKKKSTFDLKKYKTHNGERQGSVENWTEGLSQLLTGETPEVKEEKKKKAEEKLTKPGVRKIQIDEEKA